MLGRIPRRAVAATLAAAAVLIPASPALAHFCYKDFKTESAAAKAQQAGPWVTAEEFRAMILSNVPPNTPSCAIAAAEAFFASVPDTTLFMGPGFLAGGKAEPGNSAGIGYTPFDEWFACAS